MRSYLLSHLNERAKTQMSKSTNTLIRQGKMSKSLSHLREAFLLAWEESMKAIKMLIKGLLNF
jgi:hypothetical protein